MRRGTYRSDRHLDSTNPLGVVLLRRAPSPPESIADCELAMRMWQKTIPPIAKSGRLAPEDMPLLEQAFIQVKVLTRLNSMVDEVKDPVALIKVADARSRLVRMLADILGKFGVSSYGRQQLAATLAAMNAKERKRAIDELMGDDGDEGGQ